jgi:FkbM family methyltransferase
MTSTGSTLHDPNLKPPGQRLGGLRDLLSPASRWRYLVWRAGLLGKKPVRVRLASGERLILRPPPATDLQTAMEIFFCDVYRSPRPLAAETVRTIVDLGANVGYALVYFSRQFSQAMIESFEPHPAHVRQVLRHIAENHLEARASVRAEAVSNQSCRMFLRDAENQSALVGQRESECLEVPVIDWLAAASGRTIDLLKVDIEGSEYAILFDERFAHLQVSTIVVEWHVTPDHPQGGEEVACRLQSLGYEVEPGESPGDGFGLIWGYRGSAIA